MELQGLVHKLFDTQTFNTGFQKRELILMTDDQYPQPISVDFLSDKINLLDSVSQGERIKVGINIRGREWTSPTGEVKYFNSITAWRLEKIYDNNGQNTQQNMPATSQQNTAPTPTDSQNSNPFAEDEDDDLPF